MGLPSNVLFNMYAAPHWSFGSFLRCGRNKHWCFVSGVKHTQTPWDYLSMDLVLITTHHKMWATTHQNGTISSVQFKSKNCPLKKSSCGCTGAVLQNKEKHTKWPWGMPNYDFPAVLKSKAVLWPSYTAAAGIWPKTNQKKRPTPFPHLNCKPCFPQVVKILNLQVRSHYYQSITCSQTAG